MQKRDQCKDLQRQTQKILKSREIRETLSAIEAVGGKAQYFATSVLDRENLGYIPTDSDRETSISLEEYSNRHIFYVSHNSLKDFIDNEIKKIDIKLKDLREQFKQL